MLVWGEGRWHQPQLSLCNERKAFPETSQETSAYATLARANPVHRPPRTGRKDSAFLASLVENWGWRRGWGMGVRLIIFQQLPRFIQIKSDFMHNKQEHGQGTTPILLKDYYELLFNGYY